MDLQSQPQTKKTEEDRDRHIVREGKAAGTVIKLFPVQPLIIQRVTKSIQMPKRPTYEAVTMSGKAQEYPLDEVSAKDDPRAEAQWKSYQEDLQEAQGLQSERVITAILTMGTDCDVPDDGWDSLQELLGIEVPKHKDGRRASYLMYVLEPIELTEITNKIMRLTGVDESFIEQAEQSFRDSIPAKSNGQGEIPNAGRDSQIDPPQSMAT